MSSVAGRVHLSSRLKETGTERHETLHALPLAGLHRLTAIDTVRVRIALAVDLGLLVPGERLPANKEIAEALGVGEMTVRRALVSLCEAGVLERRRGRDGGTRVAAAPARGVVHEVKAFERAVDEVSRLIDQRLLLECGITHIAASRADRHALERLERLVVELDASENWTQFHRLDERFHLELAEASGVPSAAEELRRVLRALYRFYLPYPIEYLRESNAEHRRLVTALRLSDPVAAVGHVRDHVAVLHSTMFVGLLAQQAHATDGPATAASDR